MLNSSFGDYVKVLIYILNQFNFLFLEFLFYCFNLGLEMLSVILDEL